MTTDDLKFEIKQKYGFVPKTYEQMISTSPQLAELYWKGAHIMHQGSLSEKEIMALQLAISVENECKYCSAAHSKGAKNAGISLEDIQAIKDEELPEDTRLAVLIKAARMLLDKQGWLGADEMSQFAEEGVTKQNIYDIIGIISLKTITNWTNHIANTEIDEQFTS